MKSRFLHALFVVASITSVVCGAVVADSIESAPLLPSIIAVVSGFYALVYAVINCG